MVGFARCRQQRAHDLLTTICDAMQTYAADRSEQWQESERADEFAERLAAIEEVRNTLDDYR